VLFDSHCHLDVDAFAADRDQVLARARAAGVAGQLIPAIDFASWPGLLTLTDAHDDLYPAIGLHPVFLARHSDAHLDALPDWIARHRPVAVGECGLDHFVEDLDRERQRTVLRRQLQVAREFDLPVVLHARRAVDEIIGLLREVGGLRGVVHSFSGSPEQARQLWKLDFCLGIGGPVTFERAQRLRRLVAEMPIEFLLLETDAPDQPDAAHRGQRNEPAMLTVIAETIARLRGETPGHVAEATTKNARRLFGITSQAP